MPELSENRIARKKRIGYWRRDVQGLRAIAVLAVVAYHAGFGLPGGYLGVDVFFAISGFVITGLILRMKEATSSRWLLRSFYCDRFKRLTPALSLMVTTTMVFSMLIYWPGSAEIDVAAATAAGAMLLLANFVIASESGDYFGVAAENNPLLNTWSLSVEEQFYLVFPAVLLAGIWISGRRRSRWPAIALVSGGFIASFVISLMVPLGLATGNLATGFYSPLARAWEFTAGCLLALALPYLRFSGTALSRLLTFVGLALMFVAFLIGEEQNYNSIRLRLLAVGGCLLVLMAGGRRGIVCGSILTTRPLVWIGDRSYSIYLWHWPLLVFAIWLLPSQGYALVCAVVVAFGVAAMSYRWIEAPFRSMSLSTSSQRLRFVAIALGLPLLMAWVIGGSSISERIAPTVTMAGPSWQAPWTKSHERAAPTVALVGDSHAGHLFVGMASKLSGENVIYLSPERFSGFEKAEMSAVWDSVSNTPSLKIIVVSAFWANSGVFTESLVELLSTLEDPNARVHILTDIPNFSFEPEVCIRGIAPIFPITKCAEEGGLNSETKVALMEIVAQLREKGVDAELVDTFAPFCSEGSCSMAPQGQLLYGDRHHLNDEGSRYVSELIGASIQTTPTAR